MTEGREKILRLFQNSECLDEEGKLSVHGCKAGTGLSESWCRGKLEELEWLGILLKSEGGYVPRAEFDDLLRTPVMPLDHLENLAPDGNAPLLPEGGTQLSAEADTQHSPGGSTQLLP